MTPASGVLYVVATPIGNLEDLTFRALRTLKTVDLIAAEDTRRTAKLLAHYAIQKPLTSLREHNETHETPRLITRLQTGQAIALVSDAGTPAIADPGARLVAAARAAGISVVPIPGPSAVTAAISVSGLSTPEFVFLGFPPVSGAARRRFFDSVALETRSVIFFEAPHRIERTIDDMGSCLVNKHIHVHRELSKIHEEYVKQPNKSPGQVTPRGEFTVIVEPAGQTAHVSETQSTGGGRSEEIIGRLIDSEIFTDGEIAEIVSALMSLSPQAARKAVKKHKISIKRQNV